MRLFLLSVVAGLLFLLSGCSNFKKLSNQPEKENPVTGAYSHDLPCNNLEKADWKNNDLYELTYRCLPAGWEAFFKKRAVRFEIKKIAKRLKKKIKAGNSIEPEIYNTFRALYAVKPNSVKVIILGQDPAPQPGIATGLAFSTPSGVSSGRVASIQRVLLQVINEGYCANLNNGDIGKWTESGVLLLNMALTIQCKAGVGFCQIGSDVPLWERFTRYLVKYINKNARPSVFILWGDVAGSYAKYISNPSHRVIRGGHPSPAGSPHGKRFFCKSYFKCSNQWLIKQNRHGVDWNLRKQCFRLNKPGYWSWDREKRESDYYEKCQPASCYVD